MVRSLLLLATLGLCVPYLQLLLVTWNGPSKGAAPSAIAFAGAVLLALRERAALRGTPGRHPVFGCLALGVATAAYVASIALDVRIGAGLGPVAIAAALVYLLAGVRAVVQLAVPLLLLALAAPVPEFLIAALNRGLLDVAVGVVPPLLSPLVGAIQAEGYVLHFATGSVAFIEDCSGLDGVLLFVPIAILLMHVHRPMGPLRAAVVLGAALPLAFAGNVLRILVSATLVHVDSPWAYSETTHEILGIGALAIGLAGLFAICRGLSRAPTPKGVPT